MLFTEKAIKSHKNDIRDKLYVKNLIKAIQFSSQLLT